MFVNMFTAPGPPGRLQEELRDLLFGIIYRRDSAGVSQTADSGEIFIGNNLIRGPLEEMVDNTNVTLQLNDKTDNKA